MKVRISKNEWYPCYSIKVGGFGLDVEVDEALKARYDAALADFEAVQESLRDLYATVDPD